MKRFDVYMVRLDPTQGSEIGKARPAAIVSPDVTNRALRTVIIVPLTSTRRAWPTRVSTRFRGHNGELALDQIRCVDKSRLAGRLGKLDAATASATCTKLVELFAE